MTIITKEDVCPKESCKQPATGTRTVRGVENGICNNGHNWPLEETRQRRRLAEQARHDEADPWKQPTPRTQR